MPKTTLFIVFLILVQTLTSTAYAQSTLELQEKCVIEGNALIDRTGNPFSYEIHYSNKLKGCFARTAFYEKRDDGKVKGTTYLYDVFDNKIIGLLIYAGEQSLDCHIGNTKCKSVEEFDDLIAPYIEL